MKKCLKKIVWFLPLSGDMHDSYWMYSRQKEKKYNRRRYSILDNYSKKAKVIAGGYTVILIPGSAKEKLICRYELLA